MSPTYKKPKCKCGNRVQYIEIRLVEYISDITNKTFQDCIGEHWIDTEDDFLRCAKCGRKYDTDYDDKGRIIRGEERL